MKLIHIIKNEAFTARKNKDKFASKIFSSLVGEIEIVGKNNGNRETTDEEAIKVIQKFVKGVNETKKLTKDKEKLEESDLELRIYEAYLPKMMSEDELTTIIKYIVSHDSNSNIGKIMGFLSKQYKGKYDGAMASKIAKLLI